MRPPQFGSPTHWTQVSVSVSHAGVPPTQCVVLALVHCTQVFVVRSQAGVAPAQFASPTHWTQTPAVTLQ